MTSRRTMWATAVLLATLSIALAEVSIGSSPLGLIFPASWILLVPVYGAQTLLVGVWITARPGTPTLTGVWAAGAVMGLYEFYITRVLWDQPWDGIVNTRPVELLALAVLAGFYHPFISVFLPLALTERIMTGRSTLFALVPRPLRSGWVLMVMVVFWGLLGGGMYRAFGWWTPVTMLASAGVVWLVVIMAMRAPRAASLHDALPRRAGAWAAAAVVAALFVPFVVFAAVGDNTEPLERHVVAIGLYAVGVLLAVRASRHRAPASEATGRGYRELPGNARTWWRVFAVFMGAFAVGFVVPGVGLVATAALWIVGAGVAVVMTVLAVLAAFARPRPVSGRLGSQGSLDLVKTLDHDLDQDGGGIGVDVKPGVDA